MTSKGRNAVRLETEIEKSREESRWNRVIELAEQLKQRSPHQGKTEHQHVPYTQDFCLYTKFLLVFYLQKRWLIFFSEKGN